jgi:hypothetical protein
MSGVYTNLAKKRAEQSKESATAPRTPTTEQSMPASSSPQQPKKAGEKANCQLNAWITTNQDQLLNNTYFRLRASRVKIKKGELIGVAIEVLSRVLERQSPATLDASILDEFVKQYEAKK